MSPEVLVALLIPVAYLLGSVPFGLIIGKARGIDVREAGSGNIGATNVGRLLGKPFFFITLLLDAVKGLLPTAAASVVVHTLTDPGGRDTTIFLLWVAVGLAAALGHMFSIFLGFRGGKGVAVGIGVLLGIFPYATLPGVIGIAAFVGCVALTKYISVGSMIGACTVPAAYLAIGTLAGWDVLGRQWPILALLTTLAALVVLRHRTNLARLRAGTERKIGVSATPGVPDS
ncbi:MAG: glycerol-3-phosphate 1-O-acyltransferase PlsY [Planctomycetota bacterium]